MSQDTDREEQHLRDLLEQVKRGADVEDELSDDDELLRARPKKRKKSEGGRKKDWDEDQ